MKNIQIPLLKYKLTLGVFMFCLSLFLISSCKSPSKLYDKGKYNKAYDKALSSLNKGSKKREDLNVLNKSLEKILVKQNEEIVKLQDGELDDKEKAYDKYGEVIKKYEKAQKYLNDKMESRMNLFVKDRNLLADNLTETYSAVAKRNLEKAIDKDSKSDAQTAYYQFDKAIYYSGSEDEELKELQNQAFDLGVVYYSVRLESYGFYFGLKGEINSRFDDIENDIKDEFKVISYNKLLDEVDCIINLEFSDFDQDENVRSSNRSFSERVITGYNSEVDTSGNKTDVPIYETVEGTVRTNRVTRRSELELRVTVNGDRDDCKIQSRRLDEDFEEELEFYEIYGDERAIPSRFTRRNNDQFQDPDDVLEDLIDNLYRDFRRLFN